MSCYDAKIIKIMRTDVILMIFNTIDDRTNGYRSKGKRKRQKQSGFECFCLFATCYITS